MYSVNEQEGSWIIWSSNGIRGLNCVLTIFNLFVHFSSFVLQTPECKRRKTEPKRRKPRLIIISFDLKLIS